MKRECGRSGREEADILEINRIEEVEQIEQLSQIVIERCTSQQDPMNRIKSLQPVEDQIRVRLDYIVSIVQTGVEKLTSLTLINNQHLPSGDISEYGEITSGDYVVCG
jgi:hypothetical protein